MGVGFVHSASSGIVWTKMSDFLLVQPAFRVGQQNSKVAKTMQESYFMALKLVQTLHQVNAQVVQSAQLYL